MKRWCNSCERITRHEYGQAPWELMEHVEDTIFCLMCDSERDPKRGPKDMATATSEGEEV